MSCALEFETPPYRDLYERTVDLILDRVTRHNVEPDFNVEGLFDDSAVVASGKENRWARFGLKRLPINLAARPLTTRILTLRDRTPLEQWSYSCK